MKSDSVYLDFDVVPREDSDDFDVKVRGYGAKTDEDVQMEGRVLRFETKPEED